MNISNSERESPKIKIKFKNPRFCLPLGVQRIMVNHISQNSPALPSSVYWPLFKFLDLLLENEVLVYNEGIFET